MTIAVCVNYIIYYIICFLAAIISASEEAVSVNKPIVKSAKPWHFSSEYVRCFCNLPKCVTTGYMCKSIGGGCFSDVPDQIINEKGRHGCLELLDERYKCHGKIAAHERTTFRRKENPKSHLMCCHHDMCNHIESPPTKSLLNSTFLDDSVEETDSKYQQKQETFVYSDSEVWFRAATIAVPICGAVILFVLIALALKMLKSERHNSAINKLGPTLYIQPISQHKYSKEKHNQDDFHRTYDNILRKDYVISPHNNFYCSHSEDYQPQFHEPLIQNESSTSGEEKNASPPKYNLINYEESGKSIILEIEKEKPPCSQINVSNTNNYTGNVNKFFVEKTFLS